MANCRARFVDDPGKRFATMELYRGETADLTLSLDVIFHLVEDEVYTTHLRQLFAAARRFVIIYSSNREPDAGEVAAPHFRHRRFTDWVATNAPNFRLRAHTPNPFPYNGDEASTSVADFYVYERTTAD